MTSITSSSDLLTAAETAAKTAAQTNAASNSGTTASAGSNSTGDALSSLTSNYNEFLSLLTAQLQHQDPTSPMDTDSFTSELAQFAGVEQQIATNTNLTNLISLTQDGQVSQGNALVGRQAVATSSALPLQNGSAELQLDPATSGTVGIAITDSAGNTVKTATLDVGTGTTDWTWDGISDAGSKVADGTYNVAVVSEDASGNSTSVPFSIVGTITGVSKDGTTGIDLQMGSTTLEMSKVTSLLNASTATS